MQHCYDLHQVSVQNAWVTIGVFDGVHRGHQALLRQMIAQAHAENKQVVVITFFPHPVVVLGYSQNFLYLSTPEERAEVLGNLGVDIVVTQKFDRLLSQRSAKDYLQDIRQYTGLEHLWIGHDFALGRNREGNAPVLRKLGEELGFKVTIVDPLKNVDEVISSSRIRDLISSGDVRRAASLLGRPYQVQGIIVPGDQRGRVIGVPTANLQVVPEKLIPAAGVYACKTIFQGRKYAAAVNIGVRPTFESQSGSTHIEAHLLGFSGDLYGKNLCLEFVERLRSEQKFSGIEALIAQIRQDIELTRRIISE